MNTSKWLVVIIVTIIVLAGVQWYMNSNEALSIDKVNSLASVIVPIETEVISTSISVPTAPQLSEEKSINKPIKNAMHNVTIETNKGTIVFETYDVDAPNTVKNFITLAEKGFYSDVIFHRVIKDFMIQGGDPTGTGMGDPGYKFADELNPETSSYKAGYTRGVVAMANSGPNTNGSQFFIMHKDTPLPNNYSIFGKVIKGMDIVDAIANTKVDSNDKPLSPIVMKKVTVMAK